MIRNIATMGISSQQGVDLVIKFLKFSSIGACIFVILIEILTMVAACSETNGQSAVSTLNKAFIVLAETGHIVIALCILVSAFEPIWFMRVMLILHFWPGRGFAMVYLGVQTVNSSGNLSAVFDKAAKNFNYSFVVKAGVAAGWILIAVGMVFFIMSMMCLRAVSSDPTAEKTSSLEEGIKDGSDAPKKDGFFSSSSKKADKGLDAGDALVLANMAAALGLTVDAARKKYATGKVEIDKTASAPSGKKYVPPPGAVEAVQAAQGGPRGEPAPDVATQPRRGNDEPAPKRTNDDDGGRKKFQDDDDLEKAYYGGGIN